MNPWDYLQRHPYWLAGTSQRLLQSIAHSYARTLTQLPPGQTIILAEPDPIKFLAFWVAAASTPHRLVLANPNWQTQEWQQVYDRLQPHIIIGPAPAQLHINPIVTSIDQLPQPAILIPTGGTSGKIKFAIHTWETLTAAVFGLTEFLEIDVIHSCCVLPLYHVSGLMQAIRSLVTGGMIIVHPWKSLKQGNLPKINPQEFMISLVPTQLVKLIDSEISIEFLRSLRAIFLGGAPAWESLLDRARDLRLPLAPTYGMTETAGQIATLKPQDFLAGQTGCGQVLPHATIALPSTATLKQPAKLRLQARSQMLGYFPPEIQVDDPDDLGYFDNAHSLHIVGRDSTKIITGGENVFPAEIETAIRSTQLVRDVCVLGIPDPQWGEAIVAIVVPATADPTTLPKLQIHLRNALTGYKQPKHWILTDALPRNAQGKIPNHLVLKLLQLEA
jgi:O-succinylbenzoic acid--CoA ligase